ncbi:MAG: D-alanyl-D-alanine carboxypeptidase/D-alanyl-D-alanine-endopeptidase [Gemmatimonadetes bacterium]|nr:D-alanyl-D-alanine carboxypeptidase/D-alanyl-D-alanine-endopeptidase [Gemmatimonadota bacterium]
MRPLLRLRSLITAHTAARRTAARHVARCAALGLTASALLAPSPLAAVAPLAMPQTAGTGKGASKAATKPKAKPKAKPAAKTKAATKAATKPATRKRSSAPTRRTTKAVPVLRHTTPRGEIALAADLHALLTARTTSGAWGVLVSSLSHGDTLFAFRGDAPMLPASTLKLYTTALAFDRLGPGHQLSTAILRDGSVDADGTLRGSLYLQGGGDPSLSTRYAGGAGPDAPMAALARLVADAGITRIRGDVVGDASAFDSKRIPDGWLARYLNDSYAARVSALSLNENLLNVAIAPGKGQSGVVTLQPATVAYKVVNNTRTIAGSRASKLVVSRTSDGTIVARGTIGSRSQPKVYQVVVDDPALMTTGAFRKALERQGITVDGELRMGNTPPSSERVATYRSPPLSTLAGDMNRESVNHIAELLFRSAGRPGAPDGVGSAERANMALRQFLTQKVGARADAVSAADGSGLSTLDRITARSLVQLLGYANRAQWGTEFHQSLPVAGKSDMLRRRMVATPAAGNLHAKTGTTSEVIALGGYVTARNGELLAFSFLYNGTDRWRARETIDAMGATLADWSR